MSLEIRNNGCLEPAPQSANLPQPTFIIRFTAQPTGITLYRSETSILGKERAKRKLVPLYILELLYRQCTWFIHSEAVPQVLCACFRLLLQERWEMFGVWNTNCMQILVLLSFTSSQRWD